MGKYIVFLVTPKGLRRIGSKNVLRDAEIYNEDLNG